MNNTILIMAHHFVLRYTDYGDTYYWDLGMLHPKGEQLKQIDEECKKYNERIFTMENNCAEAFFHEEVFFQIEYLNLAGPIPREIGKLLRGDLRIDKVYYNEETEMPEFEPFGDLEYVLTTKGIKGEKDGRTVMGYEVLPMTRKLLTGKPKTEHHFVLAYKELENPPLYWDLGDLDIESEEFKQIGLECEKYDEAISTVIQSSCWFSVEYLDLELDVPQDIRKAASEGIVKYVYDGSEVIPLTFESFELLREILTKPYDEYDTFTYGYEVLPMTRKLLQKTVPGHFVLTYWDVEDRPTYWYLGELDIKGEDLKQILIECDKYNEVIKNVVPGVDMFYWFVVEYMGVEAETHPETKELLLQLKIDYVDYAGPEDRLVYRPFKDLEDILTEPYTAEDPYEGDITFGYEVLPITKKLLHK